MVGLRSAGSAIGSSSAAYESSITVVLAGVVHIAAVLGAIAIVCCLCCNFYRVTENPRGGHCPVVARGQKPLTGAFSGSIRTFS